MRSAPAAVLLSGALLGAGEARAQGRSPGLGPEAQTQFGDERVPSALTPRAELGEPEPSGPGAPASSGLLGAGIALFAINFTVSVTTAAAEVTLGGEPADSRVRPLFVPLYGPVVAATDAASGAERALLVLDAVGQIGGFAMAMGGLAWFESEPSAATATRRWRVGVGAVGPIVVGWF
jgi:hypothetical protein